VQLDLATEVLRLGKPTVIVLLNGGALALDALLQEVDAAGARVAIVEAFYPGPRGGEAIAQGLFGLHNRWGRLPYTVYPASFTSEADMSMHDLRVPPGRTYRYYRSPTYSFGHGLSLSSWELHADPRPPSCLLSLRTATPAVQCEVRLELRNTGTVAGDAVVTAYFRSASPRKWRSPGKLSPLKQLFGFTRQHDVPAGATSAVTFNVSVGDLALVDESSGDRVSEPGEYVVSFELGAGDQLQMDARVAGERAVLESFPGGV
jgi:hypothetical protein